MGIKRLRYWLGSLAGQVILVALFALMLIQLVGVQIYRVEREEALGLVNSRFTLQRLIAVTRLLNQSPPELHQEILRASRSETLLLTLDGAPPGAGERSGNFERIVRGKLGYPATLDIRISAENRNGHVDWPPREQRELRPHRHPPRHDIRLYGAIELADGRWLVFTSLVDREAPGWSAKAILSLVLLAALLAGLMIWLLQRTTRPLKELARQAERLGRGDKAEPIAETGPREIRETLSAFNRMQDRLDRFVSDRTRMLAAISHDLRTPITTLRLRSEFLPEGEDKQKLQDGLRQMEQMLAATLQFAREDGLAEPVRDLDLPSLLESLCDDLQDNGHDVSLEEQVPVIYRGRPTALRRALQNLLENGVKYGGKVEVRLRGDRDAIRILIRDFGPGIPEEQLEEVFKPFTRLDSARNLEDGSVGLGLAIARTLIHQHGGELSLANHPRGGLQATVTLPR
ncbi:two-component sensor histidine kinase [Zobellella denitrificans]|jgi:signal transduction histidine kinase|uniref:histidine kinase n=1 Tax=Zobellella denitrificans TaxID=347534 RepID=A0A231MXQ4_9GAMM|nr:ATP-binding protein [Zobellella denitrificans]ATG72617.1 histidine kinase [Zobellella denitrificans]OXS14957.1 two-component sensor histidine kinase [Zobellella denitrificans]